MLLNDDTVIESGALEKLVEFMDAHGEAGAVGSSLTDPDGSPQATFARFPSPIVEAVWPATNWSYRSLRDASEPFEVDSVCGAAILVRRAVIEQVGMLDTGFDPIYSEEVDWCFRIKQAGWRIYAVPQSCIIHYGSVTMNRAVPYKYEMLLSHKLLFFRKHYGALGAETYRMTLGMTTLAKLLWWTAGSLVDDGRSEKRNLHWHLLRRIPAF
jgi:GT2 family glycosyltransferase